MNIDEKVLDFIQRTMSIQKKRGRGMGYFAVEFHGKESTVGLRSQDYHDLRRMLRELLAEVEHDKMLDKDNYVDPKIHQKALIEIDNLKRITERLKQQLEDIQKEPNNEKFEELVMEFREEADQWRIKYQNVVDFIRDVQS